MARPSKATPATKTPSKKAGKSVKKAPLPAPKKVALPKKAAPKKAAAAPAARAKKVPKKSLPKGAAVIKKAAPKKAAVPKGPAPKRSAAPVKAIVPKKATPPKKGTAPKSAAPKKAGKIVPRRPGVLDKFLTEQRDLLVQERVTYLEQAESLKAEADQLALEAEPGDIQFDEESGEGDPLNVERERDLALSAQARQAVDEIDRALGKIEAGTYGICERCGQPIPRARLRALPYASLCVACKSGGLSRR